MKLKVAKKLRGIYPYTSSVCKLVELNNESTELDIRCSGHVCSGELKIVSKGNSSLIIRISGDAGWSGLRILGDVTGTFSVAIINDLATDSHLLKCEDWLVDRDSELEYAGMSSGGFLNKSDLRINLNKQGASLEEGLHQTGTEVDMMTTTWKSRTIFQILHLL